MSDREPNNLRTLRAATGRPRQRVARDLDLSERTVIRHEDGTTPLRRAHLLMYADYYGVTVDEIRSGATAVGAA